MSIIHKVAGSRTNAEQVRQLVAVDKKGGVSNQRGNVMRHIEPFLDSGHDLAWSRDSRPWQVLKKR